MIEYTFGGPLFFGPSDEIRQSVFGKQGGHYSIYGLRPNLTAGKFLQWVDFEPDDKNFFLFSTSGIHGSEVTLEEIESAWGITDPGIKGYRGREITVLLVQPRIVSMTYGELLIESLEDISKLKALRARSIEAVKSIGVSR